ncbi:MAG: hypothetical protein V7L25_33345 [Nostoc sp.]
MPNASASRREGGLRQRREPPFNAPVPLSRGTPPTDWLDFALFTRPLYKGN